MSPFKIFCVKGTLSDVHIICQESHYVHYTDIMRFLPYYVRVTKYKQYVNPKSKRLRLKVTPSDAYT